MEKTKAIALVGVGGQGTVLTSDILIEGLVDIGYKVKKTEQHGMSQRGGSVNCFIKYGEEVYAPLIGNHEADVVMAFEELEALRWLRLLKKGGTMVVNEHEIIPIPVKMGKAIYPENAPQLLKETVENTYAIKATEMAKEIGTIKVASIIMLGAAVKILGLEAYDWKSLITRKVPEKFLEQNLKAYEAGLTSVE